MGSAARAKISQPRPDAILFPHHNGFYEERRQIQLFDVHQGRQ
jgi:hypothetical protein